MNTECIIERMNILNMYHRKNIRKNIHIHQIDIMERIIERIFIGEPCVFHSFLLVSNVE